MPIANLINISFQSGVFPDIFMVVCIAPISRLRFSILVLHYHPISVLPIIGSIFEKELIPLRENDTSCTK